MKEFIIYLDFMFIRGGYFAGMRKSPNGFAAAVTDYPDNAEKFSTKEAAERMVKKITKQHSSTLLAAEVKALREVI